MNPATSVPMQTNTVALGLSLEERFEIRQKLVAIAAETKKQLDAENDAIKADMTRQGIDTYVVGDHVLALTVKDGRATLDKGELVALGVSTETLAAATKVGKPYVQLDVRKVKE